MKEWNRTIVDGVPVHWAESAGPCVAGLMFRVGAADETLAACGISHLVEHLALSAVKRGAVEMNGFVDATRTMFIAKGPREQVVEFLKDVCARLSDLPHDRLEHETRVLATEAQTFNAGMVGVLLRLRFGPQRHGIVSYPSLGLISVDDEGMRAWALDRFNAGNAVAWMTGGGPPADLRLQLPAGRRLAPVPLDPLTLEYPATAPTESSGIGVSFVVRRSSAFTSSMSILLDRAREILRFEQGLNYNLVGHYDPLVPDFAHAAIVGDTAEKRGGEAARRLWDLLEEFAAHGATPDELGKFLALAERSLEESDAIPRLLDGMALDELLGARPLTPAAYLAELRVLTPELTAAAVREALSSALLVCADDKSVKDRLRPYPMWSERPVRGRTYRSKTQSWFERLPSVIAGEDGVSFVNQRGQITTIFFSDCAAMMCGELGTRVLIGKDGSVIQFVSELFRGGDRLIKQVDAHVPPERCAPLALRRRSLSAPLLARRPAVGLH